MTPEERTPSPVLHEGVEELELRCPHCSYSLVGLTEPRCPECGTPFDRAELIDNMRRPNQPLPFGYSQGEKTSAVQIARTCLLDPARLGRDLPSRPNFADAIGYGTFVRLVSVITFAAVISIPMPNGATKVVLFFLAALYMAFFTCVCELVIAALLTAGVEPRNVPRAARFRFWLAMCFCFATYMLCTFGLLSVFVVFVFVLGLSGIDRIIYLGLCGIPIPTIVWWWYGLGRAIMARGLPSIWRPVIVALIPVIGVACVVLAFRLVVLTSS